MDPEGNTQMGVMAESMKSFIVGVMAESMKLFIELRQGQGR